MAEVVGESQSGAGVLGSSQTADGVFGLSEQGRGVVGVAKTRAGVEGNSATADGVFGLSERGRGVVGVAKAAAGVEGNSKSADGVFGLSEQGRGVVGVAQTRAGVEGNSTSGAGVFGSSIQGIGVHAKGGQLAALFEGIVQITDGSLLIGRENLVTRIEGLERELAALKAKIPSGSTPSTQDPTAALLGVEMILKSGPFNDLRVFGTGFSPNETVSITVESLTRFPDGRQSTGFNTQQDTADAQGAFSHIVAVACSPGVSTVHTARARGLSSGRVSNNAAASC